MKAVRQKATTAAAAVVTVATAATTTKATTKAHLNLPRPLQHNPISKEIPCWITPPAVRTMKAVRKKATTAAAAVVTVATAATTTTRATMKINLNLFFLLKHNHISKEIQCWINFLPMHKTKYKKNNKNTLR